MTTIQKDGCRTAFKSPDDIVFSLIGDEQLLSVCPGEIVVEPMPKEAYTEVNSQGEKKNNTVFYIIILVLFGILAGVLPKVFADDVELILFIIILPLLLLAFLAGLRIGQNALILTPHTAWVIFGMGYNKKTNSFNYNIALRTPLAEVQKHSWSPALRTLKLKIPGGYEVKVAQGKMYKKTKYYKEKVADLAEIEKMIP